MVMSGGRCQPLQTTVCTSLVRAIVSSPAGPPMARLVSGNGIKLTSSIKLINFQSIPSVHLSTLRLIVHVHLEVLALLIVG